MSASTILYMATGRRVANEEIVITVGSADYMSMEHDGRELTFLGLSAPELRIGLACMYCHQLDQLEAALGSSEPNDWIGKQVVLYVDEDDEFAFRNVSTSDKPDPDGNPDATAGED